MTRIRCFLLTPTGYDRVTLRRYRCRDDRPESACPAAATTGWGYHNAHSPLEIAPSRSLAEIESATPAQLPSHDDPRWPLACICGYHFREEDEWQRFCDPLYRRMDTGEEMTLAEAPAGAMWFAPWWNQFQQSQSKEGCLVVKTPGGDWNVDGQASNCTLPDDHRQEHHHCWIRHGVVPDITVDKDGGMTCGAGAGSILIGEYHGFLRAGYLEQC